MRDLLRRTGVGHVPKGRVDERFALTGSANERARERHDHLESGRLLLVMVTSRAAATDVVHDERLLAMQDGARLGHPDRSFLQLVDVCVSRPSTW
jgi:hypothetical protein